MSETVRHVLAAPTGSGRRRGFHRVVEDVNLNKTDGFAFRGRFVPDSREADLPVGCIVIRKTPVGSYKGGRSTWAWAVITDTATPSGWPWSEEYDGHAQFLTFRDAVAAEIAARLDERERLERQLDMVGIAATGDQVRLLLGLLSRNEERR